MVSTKTSFMSLVAGRRGRLTVSHAMLCLVMYTQDYEETFPLGRGTIDGRGAIWWRRLELANPKYQKGRTLSETEKAEADKVANGRPHLIRPIRCKDVVIERLHLKGSPEWNVHPVLCEYVRVDGLIIEAAEGSHNTDGINPESCRNVQIRDCRIDTGDDCVTLKSGLNELGRKSGRPDENITIQNCVMMRGMGKDKPSDTFPRDEGTPQFRDFLFSNIIARGAKDAGSVTGLRDMPVANLTFTNVQIESQTGFTCPNARDIRLRECRFTTTQGPALLARDSSGIDAPGLTTETVASAKP